MPTIRQLQKRIKNVIATRGWLRNYCGRIYILPIQQTYKGVNYLIQGSAADIFKQRLLAGLQNCPELALITNVHDSMFFSCPADIVVEMYIKLKDILEDVKGVRVPLLAEGKISQKNWGTCVSIKKISEIKSALIKSAEASGREWGKTI